MLRRVLHIVIQRSQTYAIHRGHAFQYAVVESKNCGDIGTISALEPVPPEGLGWRLVSSAIAGTGPEATVFHWWARQL